jgi:hypothetical protein
VVARRQKPVEPPTTDLFERQSFLPFCNGALCFVRLFCRATSPWTLVREKSCTNHQEPNPDSRISQYLSQTILPEGMGAATSVGRHRPIAVQDHLPFLRFGLRCHGESTT